jgi:murein L,D-transpeptidase YcbB/YkuD
MAASQSWFVFPTDLCLGPGDTSQYLVKLRHNLRLTGDLKSLDPTPAWLYDDSLALALKRFQQRHGLLPDGIAGARTLAALNVSPHQRARQIKLNLTRWQQIPAEAFPLVLINIPDFTLQLLDKAQKTVWQTNVIVGQPIPGYQTAILDSKISYLVLNPTWNLPQSIIRSDIIPLVKNDPAYLDRNHLAVYRLAGTRRTRVSARSINWDQADPGQDRFMVIQEAGKHNSLGSIKFIFYNTYEQYLHDTPYKMLFSHPVRTYSHGCVRVEQPEILAAYLLSPDWALPLNTGALPRTREVDKIIYLPAPVPLRIGYFTAWVNEKGILQFRPDIYGLDKNVNPSIPLEG